MWIEILKSVGVAVVWAILLMAAFRIWRDEFGDRR